MKYAAYNHNRDIYISFSSTDRPIAKSKSIICVGDHALFTVKANETAIPVTELISRYDKELVVVEYHVLELYESDIIEHVEYLKNLVLHSEQFKSTISVGFSGLSSDKDSRVITADFSMPAQQKFVHIPTKSLTYGTTKVVTTENNTSEE